MNTTVPTHRKFQIDGGYWVIETTLSDGFKDQRGYFDEPDLNDQLEMARCIATATQRREMHIQNGRYKEMEKNEKERTDGSGN